MRADIHCRLAWMVRFHGGVDHAGAALDLAEQLDDQVRRDRARAVKAVLDWFAGVGRAPDDLPDLVRSLPAALGGERLVQEATQALVNTYAPVGLRHVAQDLLERERQEWWQRDEPRCARALWGLAWLEFWSGSWGRASEHAALAHETAIQYGLEVPQDHLPLAVVAVHRGRMELARTHSERALHLADEQMFSAAPQHMAVLGMVAAAAGDRSDALAWFTRADKGAVELGWREPSVRWWTADHAELLLTLGRTEDAAALVDAWEADALRVERAWVLAQVRRCRGQVAAARADVATGEALLVDAVAALDEVGDPFGRARALLALGVLRRRSRQKTPARDAIHRSLSGFEEVGADWWASRARAELGSVGGRVRTTGLTAAESRVAGLVARGLTNREVAATLFLTERTVASHLTHIYSKLGLRSRTELVHHLDTQEQSRRPTKVPMS
ncbi:MAG TPA: LuxR C-terminal-related transcriptional regulator [Nocardioides sp.]|uniref:LuxR C-terminal-related transcriptional regulator n=1 Tax=Nocardioides sp. TaxID=35761 RepID=UPI002F3E5ED5